LDKDLDKYATWSSDSISTSLLTLLPEICARVLDIMATTLPDWCRQLKSEKWTKDSEVDVLESYFTEAITATEAAATLTTYTNRAQTASSKVGRIWTMLQLCAEECPEAHDAILELIKALVVIPSSKNTGGVDWSDEETSFKELWRDSYDCMFNTRLGLNFISVD
jgi:hypothetical protein